MPELLASKEAEAKAPQMPKPLLAVTGSQRPYVFDLPHLLSLPEGFEFRFRYRHAWIEPELVRELARNATGFSGREVIILFHSQESRRIVPIRKGTIIGLEDLGPMILFRFRVGPFVKTDFDLTNYVTPEAHDPAVVRAASDLSARAKQFLGPIDGKEDYDLSRSLPSGWYLREALLWSNSNDWDHGDMPTAWARTVAILHGDSHLMGIPFFYLLGFRTEAGATVKPSAIENRFSPGREPIHGFSLQELERYRMRVLEWCERPKTAPQPRVRLNCDFNESHLALEGASNLVVGRYDVVEFTFTAQQSGYSEVALRADNLEDDHKGKEERDSAADKHAPAKPRVPSAAWADWPTIFAARVPVVVKPKARKFITAALATVIGLGIYIWVAPQIASEHTTWRNALEVGALAILFFGYRTFTEHLERFLKLGSGLHKLRDGPQEWGKKSDD